MNLRINRWLTDRAPYSVLAKETIKYIKNLEDGDKKEIKRLTDSFNQMKKELLKCKLTICELKHKD